MWAWYLSMPSPNDIFVGPPPRFHTGEGPSGPLDMALLGVAHNSGNRLRGVESALNSGARAIEIDVTSVGGRLYAAHTPSPPIARLFFRGVPLHKAWNAASEAEVVKLDLKKSGPGYLNLPDRFLAENKREGQIVIVSSSNADALQRLGQSHPDLTLLLSIRSMSELTKLSEKGPGLALHGVSIKHGLLDEEVAAWLQKHDLLIFAWTVNDPSVLDGLVKLGVHGVMTDNLAFLKALAPGSGLGVPLISVEED
jgi:hypothetical protein